MPKRRMTANEEMLLIDVGERLDSILKRRNISQMELAKKLGVTRQRISQVVTGCPKGPAGILLIEKICSYFNINAHWLIYGKRTTRNGEF